MLLLLGRMLGLSGVAGPGSSTATFWVLEEDGTSKWILEEGTDFWITEEST